MVGRKPRFSEKEKLSMLLRLQRGENVSRLADELGIHRQRLYAWREQLRVCGNLTPSRRRGAPCVRVTFLVRQSATKLREATRHRTDSASTR
ncbi:hypothetical protein B5V01_16670 [Mesorhizobium erdmanii]|uniref:Transposase n=2 Tax=Mesorhizobium TaxID=68287 RepID=A0A3M9X436_9HYPH|nr:MULTISPECIES: helix-turn-helix domain-containing protein [Mesorhizobium]RNJ42645.1 hypothetical protein DNR46_28155 [Mesorhizobium japonicum]RXT44758.1 hypothetical protein B5V01_16670 [Mesorhizobium erdmanii]